MAFSATYTPELLAELEPLMKRPQRVMMCEETVSLVGVKQFYRLVGEAQPPMAAEQQQGANESSSTATSPPPVFERKVAALLELLGGVAFHQVIGLGRKRNWAGGSHRFVREEGRGEREGGPGRQEGVCVAGKGDLLIDNRGGNMSQSIRLCWGQIRLIQHEVVHSHIPMGLNSCVTTHLLQHPKLWVLTLLVPASSHRLSTR